MIKKQIERVKNKVILQFHTVIGIERRKNSNKRNFINSLTTDGCSEEQRFQEMIVITRTVVALRELWSACGNEAVYDILNDGK